MEEKGIMHFLKKRAGALVMGVVTLGLLLFLGYRFFGGGERYSVKNFLSATVLFEKINAKSAPSSDTLEEASHLIKKHPSLQPQYEGVLSLALLQAENVAESLSFSQNHMKRVEKLCPPLYLEFAQNGLLIEEKKYDEALEQALLFDKKLESAETYQGLRALNLVRIAFLSHQKNGVEAKAVLEKLKGNPYAPLFDNLYSEQEFTLKSYFDM